MSKNGSTPTVRVVEMIRIERDGLAMAEVEILPRQPTGTGPVKLRISVMALGGLTVVEALQLAQAIEDASHEAQVRQQNYDRLPVMADYKY